MNNYPKCRTLSVTGFSSGREQGMLEELKAFNALSCTEMFVITAVMVPHHSVYPISTSCIHEQLNSIVKDHEFDAVKLGMIYHPEIIQAILAAWKDIPVPTIVLEPSFLYGFEDMLLMADVVDLMKKRLFPLTTVLVASLKEASTLLQREIHSKSQIETAAFDLTLMGPKAVVLRGETEDCLCLNFPIPEMHWFSYWPGNRLRGSFSAAITAYLAKGKGLVEAVKLAEEFAKL